MGCSPINVTIIQVYVPTSDYDDNVIEEFYETIEDAISKTPKKDFLIVQRDWNAIVGSGKHKWGNAIGQFSIEVINQRGNILLECATKYSLLLSNTLHPHPHYINMAFTKCFNS